MRSHWVSNDVKYCPVLPSRRVPRSLNGVSTSNTSSLTTKDSSPPSAVRFPKVRFGPLVTDAAPRSFRHDGRTAVVACPLHIGQLLGIHGL